AVLFLPAVSFLTAPAYSGGPEPHTVLLLPAETPEKQTALVTPELLQRLDELGRRGVTSLRGAVLLSAAYDGSVTGGQADFRAEFQVYCFADKATLTVPLTDVKLKDGTLLDKVPAQPSGVPAGYALPVKGPGPHTVVLHFSAPLSAAGDQ